MPKTGKSYINAAYSRLYTGTDAYFNLTMANMQDNYFKSSMSNSTEGSFSAVLISGLVSGETSGDGTIDYTSDVQKVREGESTSLRYKVKVRPIGVTIGKALPDPCGEGLTPEIRQKLVEAHPWAVSDYYVGAEDPPLYPGQIITCYYEEGTIGNSNFGKLRFLAPPGGQISTPINTRCITNFGLDASALIDLFTGQTAVVGDIAGSDGSVCSDALPPKSDGPGRKWYDPRSPEDEWAIQTKKTKAAYAYVKFITLPWHNNTIYHTSVFRTPGDQNRIIRDFAVNNGYSQAHGNVDIPECPTMTQLKAYHKYVQTPAGGSKIVGPPKTSGEESYGHLGKVHPTHGKSVAIDITSQATGYAGGRIKFLKDLKKKIEDDLINNVSQHLTLKPNPFSGLNKSILETGNKCIHLGFWLDNINEDKIETILAGTGKTIEQWIK